MRLVCGLVLFLTAVIQGLSQTASSDTPGLPKDPREVFAAAAPFYDFSSATLKPWRLKATYQLFDQHGKPSEQGIYEYWWASPNVRRSSWTRAGATRTDWWTADGQHTFLAKGDELNYFESDLQSALLSPLPDAAGLDPARTRLEREDVSSRGVIFPCISLVPQRTQPQGLPLHAFPTYCFDPENPILRASYSYGELFTQYNSIAKAQGRFLPREILVFAGKQKIFSTSVDAVNGLSSSDPAFTPAPEAAPVKVERVYKEGTGSVGSLIKKQTPIYPEMAKHNREQGTVLMQATIGTDGRVHDLRVILSPSDSLAAAAMEAVSHWEYKPYMVDGEPVEVKTLIKSVFTLGR